MNKNLQTSKDKQLKKKYGTQKLCRAFQRIAKSKVEIRYHQADTFHKKQADGTTKPCK